MEKREHQFNTEKQEALKDQEQQMTEFRNRMNEVIDKLKRNEADLIEENETLQQQAQLK